MAFQISNFKFQISNFARAGVAALVLLHGVAEAATLTATVDRDRITVEDQIVYTLNVEGARDSAPPTLPDMADFQVQQTGTSSQVSIVNGSISQSVKFTYILLPKKDGEFIIPPATLVHQGQTLQSQPIRVIVQKSAAVSSPGQGVATKEQIPSRAIFVRASVSRTDPYENQQVVYSFRLYRRVDIANANLDFPEFKGFWVEDFGKQEEFTENINGVPFQVTEIKKVLFPQKSGTLSIPPALLQCDVLTPESNRGRQDPLGGFFDDPFFNRFMGRHKSERKNLRAEGLEIQVQPLPSAGRPPDFHSLVGSFTLQASMEKEELEAGGSNTLTVVAQGDGNAQDIQIHFAVDEGLYKVYDDQPSVEKIAEGDRLIVRKTYKKALVPLKEGPLSLPPVELVYFDPAAREYRALRAALKPLRVLASKEKETPALEASTQEVVEKKKIDVIGKDIFPIFAGPDLPKDRMDDKSFWVLIALATALPSIFFVGALVMIRAREKMPSGSALYRSRTALSQAEKKLKEADSLSRPDQAQELFSKVSRVVKDYLGDKLGISGAALTAAETGELLRRQGVEEETLAEAVRLLEHCEAGCFAPRSVAGGDLKSLPHSARTLIKKLEKKLR